jgi:DNA mismatch endonuclease (patch repair protein)
MPDSLSPSRRSWNMSRIRSADTAPERMVRSLLHTAGFRFRLHRRDLPGKPDIVLPGRRAVVFVHGCFWHRHRGCSLATTPGSNIEFWKTKFEQNVARDRRNASALRKLGWKVTIVWECQTRHPERLLKVLTGRLRLSP